MNTTSPSLLEQLRDPRADAAWRRFVELYSRLIYYWAKQTGLKHHDACDLVQDVLVAAVRSLPEFEYDSSKSFRSWLRTIALNKWRDGAGRRIELQVEDSLLVEAAAESSLNDAFELREYRQQLLARAMALVEGDFKPRTWRAFLLSTTTDRPAGEIAAELGTSTAAVYAARFRVLTRLRQELAGLLD